MADATPLVLVMAGGTGGHVYPALAVATELRDRGYRIAWVGTSRGLESRVVPAAGITLHHLPMRGVRGKNLLHKALGVVMLMVALVQALVLVYRLAPRCVIGLGGYAAGPAGLAAWLLRKPLVIHEQNAVAGTTNRLLAPMAKTVVAGFPGAFREDINYEVLGNPVRRELLAAAVAHPWDFDGQRPLRLLIVGGSLGAKPLNDLVPGVVRKLLKSDEGPGLEVWHQSGAAHGDAVRSAYGRAADGPVKITEFIEDMAGAYGWADLVLCRAGALTVAELAIMGRPALLVPLPHAIDDHQTANARALTDRGAGIMLKQSELNASRLHDILQSYLSRPERLAIMAAAARDAAHPDATRDVADRCEEFLA